MKYIRHIFVISFFLATTGFISAKQTKLVDIKGRSVVGNLIKTQDGNITFTIIKTGKKYTLPISNFDQTTQDTITKWNEKGGNLSTNFDVTITTGKNVRKIRATHKAKKLNLNPKIVVKNKDVNFASKDLDLVICFLGQSTERKTKIYVYTRDVFKIQALEPLKSVEFECTKTSHDYREFHLASFGSKYFGYCWAIVDQSEGDPKIIQYGSAPPFLAKKYHNRIIELEADTYYSKKLEDL